MAKGPGRKGGNPRRPGGLDEPTVKLDRQGNELEPISADQLREQIKQRLEPELFQQLDVQMMRMSMWRSDWPPPDCLDGYTDEERSLIMDAVRKRTHAGIEREKMVAERTQRRMDRGQIFGLLIALSSIVGAVYLGSVSNNWWVSAIAIVLALAGIGGPSVARLIADRYYLRESPPKPHQSPR